jgi:outer membrane protein assembly factor BamC
MSCCYLLASGLCGCSTIDKALPDYRNDYRTSTTERPLEIPPDLIGSTSIKERLVVPKLVSSKSTTLAQPITTEVPAPTSLVLPKSTLVKIKHEGNIRWLEIANAPDKVWAKVKAFWVKNNIKLKTEKPQIGIMETEWIENRLDITQHGIRKHLDKVLDVSYSSATRDKFRVRLESGKTAAGITAIYLTHKGAEKVAQGKDFVWQSRPSDHELEAEMLNRLKVFLSLKK